MKRNLPFSKLATSIISNTLNTISYIIFVAPIIVIGFTFMWSQHEIILNIFLILLGIVLLLMLTLHLYEVTVSAANKKILAARKELMLKLQKAIIENSEARHRESVYAGIQDLSTQTAPKNKLSLALSRDVFTIESLSPDMIKARQLVLWRLEVAPPAGSALMRAYFVALIIVQIGTLKSDTPFFLWNGNFKTHTDPKKDRLRRRDNQYVLTKIGVEYFSTGKSAPREELLNQFIEAIKTGNENSLPSDLQTRKLIQMNY